MESARCDIGCVKVVASAVTATDYTLGFTLHMCLHIHRLAMLDAPLLVPTVDPPPCPKM